MIQNAFETHTGITANFLQSKKDTSTSPRQGQREAWDNGTTGHPGASTTWWGHKCITSSVAAEEKWISETMRGPESSPQWQSYGRG